MSNEHITDEQLQTDQFEQLLTIGLRDELRPAIPAVIWLFRAWLESADLRPAAQPVGEPFGYFRAEPFGWTDCKPDDAGAVALHEHPPHRLCGCAACRPSFEDDDQVERALDEFERRERGLPQAQMAAKLVAELRAVIRAQRAKPN